MRRVLGLSDSLRSRHSSSRRNDSASESDSRSPARPAVSSARSARISSKSSPPRSARPALATTVWVSSSISTSDASKVPPPRSYTSSDRRGCPLRWARSRWPNSTLAAEGSLSMPSTWKPAARKASAVRNRWLLLALAGTPIMASIGSARSSDSVEAWRNCWRNAESSSVASSITGIVQPARSSCVVGPARFSSRLSERNTVHSRSPCTAHAFQPKRRSLPRIATSGGNHSRVCPSGDSKADQRVVSAVRRRGHDTCCAEIDSQFHREGPYLQS